MAPLKRSRVQDPIRYDEVGPVYAENPSGQAVCGSRRSNGAGGVCMSTLRNSPSGRCRMHGGAKGIGRPITKGLWSNSLPTYLQQDFEKALEDPDIGNMRDSIALMDAFIAQYLKGLLKTPPVETLQAVVNDLENQFPLLLEECEAYPIEMEDLIKSCVKRLKEVTSNRSQEIEIRKSVRERAELVKVEAMRIDKASRFVTVEQAMALIAALITIVNKHVTNEQERLLISGSINHLVSKGASERDQSGRVSEPGTEIIPTVSSREADPT